jgi:hypothetical protein
MSSSTVETKIPSATQVHISDDTLTVDLSDGRSISVPLAWFPRLSHGNASERQNWRLIAGGLGIHWTDLDEDISIENMLAGQPSGESQTSFKKWLAARGSKDELQGQVRNDAVPIPETLHPGIREHFIRAALFNNLGMKTSDSANKFRVFLAAIYSCRAMVELMLDRADRGESTVTRDELKERLVQILPYFNLIERIRIHDFHRYGLIPNPPGLRVVMALGPMKLTANQGGASWAYTAEGPTTTLTGKSGFKPQRPLYSADGRFFDEDSKVHVEPNKIVVDYLKAIPAAIAEFEQLLTPDGRNAYPTPALFPHMYGGEVRDL